MPFLPTRVDEDFVLRKCRYFSKVALWERRASLSPESWLNNFEVDEREYAVSLLNAFLYFSNDLMLELLRGAFHGLSRTLFAGRTDRIEAWRDFADRAVFTPVRADIGDPAESGLEWTSRWKKDLHLADGKTVWSEEAMRRLLDDPTVPVVFLDDFVGSGRQMRAMWEREINVVGKGGSYTFVGIAAETGASLIYTPALCTAFGRRELAKHCPTLYVNPGNEITDQHNALGDDSVIWPEEHRAGARQFVEAASARAGIPAELCEGYERLGLVLGYGQSVPDATLPLIYWEEDGWQPLMKRG